MISINQLHTVLGNRLVTVQERHKHSSNIVHTTGFAVWIDELKNNAHNPNGKIASATKIHSSVVKVTDSGSVPNRTRTVYEQNAGVGQGIQPKLLQLFTLQVAVSDRSKDEYAC